MVTLGITKIKNSECSQTIFNRKIDACKLTDAFMNSLFLNVFFKNLEKTVNFNLRCPFVAGRYSLTDFTLHIPPILPFPDDIFICSKVVFSGKPKSSKRFMRYGGAGGITKYKN